MASTNGWTIPLSLLLLSSSALSALAPSGIDAVRHNQMLKRQASSTSRHRAAAASSTAAAAAAAGAATPAASGAAGGAGGSIQTGTNQPIAASMTTEPTSALPTTYAAGATAPISGAPALPSSALVIANYPALDQIPPTSSSEVQQWLSQIDMTQVPTNDPTGLNGCSNTTNAQALANAGSNGNCWWTCGGCTRPDDITTCPSKGTWGTSFDDGPSPDTPKLLDYLDANSLKTTFFVVGSRVLSRPDMLQYEYMAGHQISVHTWSHPSLTTLTNEQIVAELGWSKKVIKDTIGVTPNTFRPPYGDIDDRVRYIAKAMGLTPIIWTSTGSETYDTEDWKIAAGTVTPSQVLSNFEQILAGYSSLSTGFIVLAHDLYQQSVDLAVQFVLPQAVANKALTLQPIITCLGQGNGNAYIETTNNSTSSGGSSASGGGASASGKSRSGGSGTAASAGAAATSGTSSSSSSSNGSTSGSEKGMWMSMAVVALASIVGLVVVA